MSKLASNAVALEFFASVLAMKGIISIDEEEAIYNACTIEDLDAVIDSMTQLASGDAD